MLQVVFHIGMEIDLIKNIINLKNEMIVENHQLLSFSSFFARKKIPAKLRQEDSVFFPGCSLMSLGSDAVFELYEILLKKHPDMGLSGFCCGKPSKHIGGGVRFEKRMNRIKEEHSGRVYTACPNCYNTLGESGVEVISIWPIIDEFFPQKKLGMLRGETMMIHDPCSARRNEADHEAVRSIMNKLGIKVIEFENNRKRTMCCGKINMTMALNKELGMSILKKRVSECSTDKVASYCASCVHSFGMAEKKGMYISELLIDKKISPSWGKRIEFVKNNL